MLPAPLPIPTDYRKSELWQPKKRSRRTSQWMSAQGCSVKTAVWITPTPTQIMVGIRAVFIEFPSTCKMFHD
ncbi:hypothetical protein L9F63_005441, partial [Diploptera punctata]